MPLPTKWMRYTFVSEGCTDKQTTLIPLKDETNKSETKTKSFPVQLSDPHLKE